MRQRGQRDSHRVKHAARTNIEYDFDRSVRMLMDYLLVIGDGGLNRIMPFNLVIRIQTISKLSVFSISY